MQFLFQGSHEWYIKLQARNTNFPVKVINVFNSGVWKALQRTNDNFFTSSGNIVFPLKTPFRVQVVSITGEIVESTINSIVNDQVLEGNGQFQKYFNF
jgi:expansin (peptidoglycan-binding protein)